MTLRTSLHALLLFAVALCGLHIAEPVQAHGKIDHASAMDYASPPTQDNESGPDSSEAAHANAHHCPHAADTRYPIAAVIHIKALRPAHGLSRALASRMLAPPDEPPLA